MSILIYLGVVFSVTLADICWTFYFIETNKRNSVKAAVWSTLIIAAGAFTTSTYVENKDYITAALIGSMIGTFTAVEWKKHREKNKDSSLQKEKI